MSFADRVVAGFEASAKIRVTAEIELEASKKKARDALNQQYILVILQKLEEAFAAEMERLKKPGNARLLNDVTFSVILPTGASGDDTIQLLKNRLAETDYNCEVRNFCPESNRKGSHYDGYVYIGIKQTNS